MVKSVEVKGGTSGAGAGGAERNLQVEMGASRTRETREPIEVKFDPPVRRVVRTHKSIILV